MARKIKPGDPDYIAKAAFELRCDYMRDVGCLCCGLNKDKLGLSVTGFGIPEIHHLNEGGVHGGKRRGDRFTIPLCSYHHRGTLPPDARRLAYDKDTTIAVYGPSWAHGSKPFRDVYPTDDELLAVIDGPDVSSVDASDGNPDHSPGSEDG